MITFITSLAFINMSRRLNVQKKKKGKKNHVSGSDANLTLRTTGDRVKIQQQITFNKKETQQRQTKKRN